MYLALTNLQRLKCHKTQPINNKKEKFNIYFTFVVKLQENDKLD